MSQIPNAISVVIPTYNRAHLIKESLQSVLNQTLKPYEIIVVDDFSTDNTEEVIKSLNSPLIKYVKNQRKKGANGARNTGIFMSQGEYIAFHDSDDIWLSEKLELQRNFFNSKFGIDLCFCSINTDSKLITPKRRVHDQKIKDEIKKKNIISTQTILLRNLVAREILFDESIKRFQDWDFCLRCSAKYKISHLDEVLVLQKLSSSSVTRTISYLDSYERIFEKYPDLYKFGIFNKTIYLEILNKKKKTISGSLKLFYLKFLRKMYLFFSV